MDAISQKVRQMYCKYPFPSPRAGGQKLTELADLLEMFCIETNFSLANRNILDAGTGTGHRLVEAAAAHPNCRFVAIEFSEVSLEIARANVATRALENVELSLCDIMSGTEHLGRFDIVTAMGVLHHLRDPVRGLANLVKNVSHDGILFLYIYGRLGARERMRRKQMISLLCGGGADFEMGITLARELGFDSFDYGWNMGALDHAALESVIVDAYLHVNEALYTFEDIVNSLRPSGLAAFSVYGLTCGTQGSLLDMDFSCPPMLKASETVRCRYKSLSVVDKHRLADLLYEPNGYTVIGFTGGAIDRLEANGRLKRNMIRFDHL